MVDWVFVYELICCGFESSSSHLYFRFYACFEQEVPWHSSNYRVWIYSETRPWHDKNKQTNTPLNAKINVVKNELPSITINLTTTTALNAKINEVITETLIVTLA